MHVNGFKGAFNCGATTLTGISYIGLNLAAEIKSLVTGKEKWAFYVMAAALPKDPVNSGGEKLKKYIEEHNLGEIIETDGWHYNECHGPLYIKVYVYRPDYDTPAMKKWLKDNENIKVNPDMRYY